MMQSKLPYRLISMHRRIYIPLTFKYAYRLSECVQTYLPFIYTYKQIDVHPYRCSVLKVVLSAHSETFLDRFSSVVMAAKWSKPTKWTSCSYLFDLTTSHATLIIIEVACVLGNLEVCLWFRVNICTNRPTSHTIWDV